MSNYNYCIINNNISVEDSSLSLLSTLNLFIFYGMVLYSFKHLMNLEYKTNKTTLTYYCSDIINSKNYRHTDSYKNTLFYI